MPQYIPSLSLMLILMPKMWLLSGVIKYTEVLVDLQICQLWHAHAAFSDQADIEQISRWHQLWQIKSHRPHCCKLKSTSYCLKNIRPIVKITTFKNVGFWHGDNLKYFWKAFAEVQVHIYLGHILLMTMTYALSASCPEVLELDIAKLINKIISSLAIESYRS